MKKLILALLILAGTVHAQSLIVISGSKTRTLPSGTPTFSPGAGSYGSTQSVTISTVGRRRTRLRAALASARVSVRLAGLR